MQSRWRTGIFVLFLLGACGFVLAGILQKYGTKESPKNVSPPPPVRLVVETLNIRSFTASVERGEVSLTTTFTAEVWAMPHVSWPVSLTFSFGDSKTHVVKVAKPSVQYSPWGVPLPTVIKESATHTYTYPNLDGYKAQLTATDSSGGHQGSKLIRIVVDEVYASGEPAELSLESKQSVTVIGPLELPEAGVWSRIYILPKHARFRLSVQPHVGYEIQEVFTNKRFTHQKGGELNFQRQPLRKFRLRSYESGARLTVYLESMKE